MKYPVFAFIIGAVLAGALPGRQAEAAVGAANSGSALEFRRQMYTTDIFTGENFKFTPYTIRLQPGILPSAAIDDASIKEQLAGTVYDACMARVAKNAAVAETGWPLTVQHCERSVAQIKDRPLERFVRGAAADALAEWVFRVDGDNWYRFDSLLRETRNYLVKPDRELFMLRGFSPRDVLVDTLSTEDLPVVIDLAEGTFTLWTLELAD